MDIYDELSLIQIKKDSKFLIDLTKSIGECEFSSIFYLNILPFISLLMYESNNFINNNIFDIKEIVPKNEENSFSIADVRMKNKLFYDKFNKSKRAIKNIEYILDSEFKESDRELIYYNIGIYTNMDKNIIGNTFLDYYFFQEETIKKLELGKIKELVYQRKIKKIKEMSIYTFNYSKYLGHLCKFFYDLTSKILKSKFDYINDETYKYKDYDYKIFFQDFNTYRDMEIFPIIEKEKIVKLYLLNLLSMINFVIYFFNEIVSENLNIIIRMEYIVYYYISKSLKELYTYMRNESILNDSIKEYYEAIDIDNVSLLNSDFRNCMMHYSYKNPKNNEEILKKENIDMNKPYFGLIESCFSMTSDEFEKQLRGKLINLSKILNKWLNITFNDLKLL